MPASERTELKSPQTVLGHEMDDSTALCNDAKAYAKCSESMLPQGPESPSTTAVPKPHQCFKAFHLQTPARDWWLPAQHDFLPSDNTEKKLVILDTAQRVPEHEKKKWNDLPKVHHTVTVRTKNMTSDYMCPSPLLLSWALHRLKGDGKSCFKEHETRRTTQRWQHKGKKPPNNFIICNIFYKSIICLHLQ